MKTIVKSVMTRKLITVPAGSSLQSAQELMQEKRIRHLPVTDARAEIVGVLSETDVKASHDLNVPVEQAMCRRVDFVHEEVPLRSAILKMLEKKLSAILICDDARDAVGIITTDDLLWYLAHTLEKEKDHGTLMSLLDIQTMDRAATQISNAGL